jgi:hypothetical protein
MSLRVGRETAPCFEARTGADAAAEEGESRWYGAWTTINKTEKR